MSDLLNNVYVIKGLQSLVGALVIFILARVAQAITVRRRKHTSEAPFAIQYTAIFLYGIILVFIWLDGLGPVLTALTIVAAALTIVSKDLIANFLGSFVIFWRELFAIGDRVQVADCFGDVIGKGILFFTLLETGSQDSTGHSTGRLIKIPNSYVMTYPVINATRGAGYVWNEYTLTVTRNSDWAKARKLLLDCVEEYRNDQSIDLEKVKAAFESKKVFFRELNPIAYVEVTTGGITLTVRYLCRSRMIRESEDFITTRMLASLEPGVVELAEAQSA